MVDSKSKKRLLAVTVILLAVIGFMIYNSSASTMSYFKKVYEIDKTYVGKSVRVGGVIAKDSWTKEGRTHTFKIYDKKDKGRLLTVVYSGPLPSTFGDNDKVIAIAEGKLVSADKLEAKSIVTQCPSKYESEKKNMGGK